MTNRFINCNRYFLGIRIWWCEDLGFKVNAENSAFMSAFKLIIYCFIMLLKSQNLSRLQFYISIQFYCRILCIISDGFMQRWIYLHLYNFVHVKLACWIIIIQMQLQTVQIYFIKDITKEREDFEKLFVLYLANKFKLNIFLWSNFQK